MCAAADGGRSGSAARVALNEGHLPQHHRDGTMRQLWADTGFWHDRFALSVGAGPYLYFDTEYYTNSQGYLNQHGVGLILSGRLSYAFAGNWFVVLDINRVMFADPGTRTVMLVPDTAWTVSLRGSIAPGRAAPVPGRRAQ